MTERDNKNKQGIKKSFLSRFRKFVIVVLMVSIVSGSALTAKPKEAEAFGFICFCVGIACDIPDVIISTVFFFLWRIIWDPIIKENIEDHINSEENWIVEDFFEDFWVKGLAELTEFLSASGMYQMEILGGFFDAKQQLETQRLFWRLHATAHADYHPSDDFCWFGTNARSLAATEARSSFTRSVMSRRSITRQLGNQNASSAGSKDSDQQGRWQQFVKVYCDPKDNNWNGPKSATVEGTGLDLACDHDGSGAGTVIGGQDPLRINRDIDYTRLIDTPRSLEVNFDSAAVVTVPADEEDVLAMASNLYGNNVPSGFSAPVISGSAGLQNLYLALRSVVAKRSVAENSFNAIVAMKSAGTGSGASSAPQPQQVRQFMAALIKDLMPAATPDEDIYEIIGENPSYYSQLEVLAKRIYENPRFYSNLYDTPTNVARKSVAMKGIESMLDRALYESELRQEMIMSVLLSAELRQRYKDTNKNLQRASR
jgi:hypothetical protein